MVVDVSWPSESKEPYEVEVKTGNGDLELVEPESEYDRFEDLATKLVAVPKRELDKKRRES